MYQKLDEPPSINAELLLQFSQQKLYKSHCTNASAIFGAKTVQIALRAV